MPQDSNLAPDPQRRLLLQAGAGVAAASLLAACGAPPLKPDQPSAASTRPHLMNNNEIYLLALSGTLPKASQRDAGIARLTAAGFTVSNQEAVSRQYQRFAGTDEERLSDLHNLLKRDAMPRMLLAGRGGYGACRLLPRIDFGKLVPRLKEAGTQVVGYSDFTALQLALLAKGGMGSFAGPMLYSDIGGKTPSPYALQQFMGCLSQSGWQVSVPGRQAETGRGEGLFWGGNLSVLSSLAGSPYLPDIAGGLLFLEDVGEQPYRLERMLQQLYLAGILQKQKAIFLGDFSMGRIVDAYDPSYTLGSVISQMRRELDVPIYTGLPFGHIHDKTTLPLGFPAKFACDENGLTLSFFDYPAHSADGLQPDALLSAI